MKEFIVSFGDYWREAQFETILFWAYPIGSFIAIWLLTTLSLKLFTQRKKLKRVFNANRFWIISALIGAGVLISITSYWWTIGYFGSNPLRLSLLLSITVAMVIPVLRMFELNKNYTLDGLKEIIDQPKTSNQLEITHTFLKRAFNRLKINFIIPLFGFLFLLLYLNKSTNLISIVFDNSGSMEQTNAISALAETFDNLHDNNEIILTTLDGYTTPEDPDGKKNINELMSTQNYSSLKAGNVVFFNNPKEAKNGLAQASNLCNGSPISEAIWKTHLFINQTKSNQIYEAKLLIIITDGIDGIDESLESGEFFFSDPGFSQNFPPENVFIIDYSRGSPSNFMRRYQNAGSDVYPADNNKQDYLIALNNALQLFQNNWNLIYWEVSIFLFFVLVGLLIQPKKII